jgi:hypothetical protein
MCDTCTRNDKSQFEVEGYGKVGLDNACFTMFCEELDAVDAMDVGHVENIAFKSGAGRSILRVERVA